MLITKLEKENLELKFELENFKKLKINLNQESNQQDLEYLRNDNNFLKEKVSQLQDFKSDLLTQVKFIRSV